MLINILSTHTHTHKKKIYVFTFFGWNDPFCKKAASLRLISKWLAKIINKHLKTKLCLLIVFHAAAVRSNTVGCCFFQQKCLCELSLCLVYKTIRSQILWTNLKSLTSSKMPFKNTLSTCSWCWDPSEGCTERQTSSFTLYSNRSFTLPLVLLSGVAKVHGLCPKHSAKAICAVLLGSSLDF